VKHTLVSEALLPNYNRNEQLKDIPTMTYKSADLYFSTKFFLCENRVHYRGCYLFWDLGLVPWW